MDVRVPLLPTVEQAAQLKAWGGALRWLHNHFRDLSMTAHAKGRRQLWRDDLQREAVRLKAGRPWLAEPPAHAVLNACTWFAKRLSDALALAKEEGGSLDLPLAKRVGHELPIFVCGDKLRLTPQQISIPKLGWVMTGSPVDQQFGRLVSARIVRLGEDQWTLELRYIEAREYEEKQPLGRAALKPAQPATRVAARATSARRGWFFRLPKADNHSAKYPSQEIGLARKVVSKADCYVRVGACA